MLFIITFLLIIQFGVFSNEIDSFDSESISDSNYDDSESEYFESSSDNIIETCSSFSSSSEEEENGMNINSILFLIFWGIMVIFVGFVMIYAVIKSTCIFIYQEYEKKGKLINCNCSCCLRNKNKDDDEFLSQMITA